MYIQRLRKLKKSKITKWVLIISLLIGLFLPVIYANNEDVLVRLASTSSGVGYSVDFIDNYIFLTDNDGVSVYDVSNPRRPLRVSQLRLADGAFDLDFKDGVAYIAADEEGLVIVDYHNIEQPEILGSLNFGSAIFDVVVEDYVAYLADISNGLRIADVSNTGDPFEIGSYYVNDVRSVEILEDVVYLAVPNSGIIIVNVSDPVSPSRFGVVSGTQAAINLHLGDKYLFFSCHNRGTKIMDIRDPFTPSLVGEYSISGGESFQTHDHGDLLFIADVLKGVRVLNISDPENPQIVASFGTKPHDVFYDGEFTYLANEHGLEIIHYEQSGEGGNPEFTRYSILLTAIVGVVGLLLILFLRARAYK